MLGGWLSILPLDHVRVTPCTKVEEASRGPNHGSDHTPVRVHLVLQRSGAQASWLAVAQGRYNRTDR
jgi:hypothetical protein